MAKFMLVCWGMATLVDSLTELVVGNVAVVPWTAGTIPFHFPDDAVIVSSVLMSEALIGVKVALPKFVKTVGVWPAPKGPALFGASTRSPAFTDPIAASVPVAVEIAI